MSKCGDCVHWEICNPIVSASEDSCTFYKDSSRFVELPIKPGEKIYYFDTAGRVYKSTVDRLVYVATGFLVDSDVMFDSNLIGARFFLTREAAEQALKERDLNGGNKKERTNDKFR